MKVLNMIVAGLPTLPGAVGARDAAPPVDKMTLAGIVAKIAQVSG